MIKNKEGYITSNEAAKLTGFSADHIRRLLSEGKIKGEKFGRIWIMNSKALSHIKRQRFPRLKELANGSD